MEAENDLHSDHLDRLFEHRNKEYGAYTWRKAYNRQLIKGRMGMCLMVTLCVGGYFIWSVTGRAPETKKFEVVASNPCSMDEDLLVPAELDTKRQKPALIGHCYNVPVIMPDTILEEQAVWEDVLIAGTICEGIADNLFLPVPPPPEEIGKKSASSTDSVEPECFFGGCIEIRPQYPGGRDAMLRFIDSALGFPGLVAEMDSSMEEMEKVKVLARFRIEADGQLTDIRFPHPAIEPYQTQVRRVLQAMPKWIPGTQNGKPVPMYLGLPVHFLLIEE